MEIIPRQPLFDEDSPARLPDIRNYPFYTGTYVYFIEAETSGLIKIGISSDVRSRLSDLQNANGDSLRLIGKFPGGIEIESELHRTFKVYQVKREWFRPGPSLAKFIHGIFPQSYKYEVSKKPEMKGKHLSAEDVVEIKRRFREGVPYGSIVKMAAEFNVPQNYISQIKNGRLHADI